MNQNMNLKDENEEENKVFAGIKQHSLEDLFAICLGYANDKEL